MSSIYNVILVIAFAAQWICQGITVQPTNQNKVFLLLPKTTALPPQLAYYVQGRGPSDSVYNKNEHFDKSASLNNGGVLSVIEAPYSKRNRPTRGQNSNFGFVQPQKHQKLVASPNKPSLYQSAATNPRGSYNYQQYYGLNLPNQDSIVRATPPPERRPGRTPPPPSNKVTFQVNMIERNYRAQQDFEQRNANPHFRNQALRQVQSPSLTTESPKNHKVLRNNINHLKKTQREHFSVDEDEQPAHQRSNADDVEQVTPRHRYSDLNQFRDEESHYDRLKKQNGHSHSGNYEESEPKFTNFYDEIDDRAKYLNHENFVTPASYQNYNNDHDDEFEVPNFSSKYKNYDDDDEPSSKYSYNDDNSEDDRETFNPYQKNVDSYGAPAAYITNEEVKEFDKYLRSTPRYVGPKKKHRSEIEDRNGYNDRSDKGDDHDFVPYKMLASVRHSEKYEQQPKDLSNPLLKERILEKGGHVVYTEQGYEDKQYDHGNAEKFANVKHRKRRHVSEDKFPFYYSTTRNIPKYSALRYAENVDNLRNGRTSLYDTKRKVCDDVDFDESNVNDKDVNFKSKKRLVGLEDKIDCLKKKLFGTEPLNNPIFQEQFVDEVVPVVKPRRVRSSLNEEPYSTLVNVFDDVTSNIEQLSTSHNQFDHTPSGSSVDYVVFPPYVDLANSKMNSKNESVLDIVAKETSNQDKPPVVILMEEQAFEQMNKNDSRAKYTGYLKYPQSDGTEVFIFDISKFIPKLSLPVSEDYYDSAESVVTTEATEISTDPPKKSVRMKLKMRRNQIKKNLDGSQNKHLGERYTNVVRGGVLLAQQPYILPGSYDLHHEGNSYR